VKIFLLLAVLAAQTPPPLDAGPPESTSTVIVGNDIHVTAPLPASAPVAPDAVLAALDAPPAPVDDVAIVADGFREMIKAITNWKSAGALAIAAAIIALLMRLSKLGVLYRLLEARGWTWARPWIAGLLGGAGAALTAFGSGVHDFPSLVSAFVSGVLAGFTAGGGYDAGRLVFAAERNKKRVDVDALNKLTEIAAESREKQHVIESARDLPPHKRAEVLAATLGKHQ